MRFIVENLDKNEEDFYWQLIKIVWPNFVLLSCKSLYKSKTKCNSTWNFLDIDILLIIDLLSWSQYIGQYKHNYSTAVLKSVNFKNEDIGILHLHLKFKRNSVWPIWCRFWWQRYCTYKNRCDEITSVIISSNRAIHFWGNLTLQCLYDFLSF